MSDTVTPEEIVVTPEASILPPIQPPNDTKPWKLVCICLLVSTLLQANRPSDPYHPNFLTEIKGTTEHDLNNNIFQWRTYSYLFALLPVSFLCEIVTGYVPLIIAGLSSRLGTQFILYYGNSLLDYQLGYAMFGFSQSTQIIYSAHLYRMVPLHVFHRITGYLRAAHLSAHVLGGILGGWYVQNSGTNWFLLFSISQISVAFGIVMFIFACFFSWRTQRLQSNFPINAATKENEDSDFQTRIPESIPRDASEKLTAFFNMMRDIYSSPTVICWSCWWWVGTAVIDSLIDYQPVLFAKVNGAVVQTGYIFAAAHLCGAATALLAGYSRPLIDAHGTVFLSAGSVLIGLLLFVSSTLSSIYLSYACFVLFLGAIEFYLVASSAQVAMRIDESRRGVALLTNTTLTMLFEALMQFVSLQLDLGIRQRFVMYAIVMVGLGVFLLLLSCVLKGSPLDTDAGISEPPLHDDDDSQKPLLQNEISQQQQNHC